jgi:pimeloyl-ACP methyl ester carboxylesterase
MPTDPNKNEDVWQAYYEAFDYFAPERVRPGCHPRIREHRGGAANAIVLVHGLSDSPYFVSAIGAYFFQELGYNVYMPLLHFHGLKDPENMEGVELEEWERNVGFAVDCAQAKAETVSIGGLSTGGALSLLLAVTRPGVTGDLYLFSAALDLAGGPWGLVGEMKEWLLGTFLADVLDNRKPLIGDHPYRYGHVDLDGARELARLIKRTDTLLRGFSRKHPFPLRVFAAHSEADTTADIAGIERLQRVCDEACFTFMRFPRQDAIAHASLVLEEAITGISTPEAANPRFAEMMAAIKAFEARVAAPTEAPAARLG